MSRIILPPTYFGIEYTFVPQHDFVDLDELVSHVERQGLPTAHEDHGAIEISSPPHPTLNHAKIFYERMERALRGLPIVAKRIDKGDNGDLTYFGTGGGHIHQQICTGKEMPLTYPLVRNMLILIANAPWLGWVFNEFMDDENALNICGDKGLMKVLDQPKDYRPVKDSNLMVESGDCGYSDNITLLRGEFLNTYMLGVLISNPSSLLITRSGYPEARTLEMRFFDAPQSWQQTQEHLNIAFSIYRMALNLAKRGIKPALECKSLRDVAAYKHRPTVEREFRAMIKGAGLEWCQYRKYMQNFDDRKAYGKLV
jgi:hypothetical protein